MAKKSKKTTASGVVSKAMSSNIAPILEMKFGLDPLFTMSAHPSQNIIVTGSATGHLKSFKYDSEVLESKVANYTAEKKKTWKTLSIGEKTVTDVTIVGEDEDGEEEGDTVSLAWKTKRHKGSIRALTFDATGDNLYTAGLDKFIKKANSETGQVILKIEATGLKSNITKIITAPEKNFLIVGTEGGSIHCYDTRDLKEIYKIPRLHDDSINSITNYYPKSQYQFITTGSTTLSHFDIRKEKPLMTSEDQEDELLCASWVDPTNPSILMCGMGEGIVTVWKPEMNKFNDQISRVRLGKESVESLCSAMDSDGNYVWAGTSDGLINKIDVGLGKPIESRYHGSTDEVSMLDLDYNYRLISAGMDKLKIWSNGKDDDDEDDDDVDDDFDKNSSDESDYLDSDDEKIEPGTAADTPAPVEEEEEEEWTGIQDSADEDGWEDVESSEHEFSSEMSDQEEEEVNDSSSDDGDEEGASSEEEDDDEEQVKVSENLKHLARESVKKRFASMVSQPIDSKRQKSSIANKSDSDDEDEKIDFNEVSDSDDDEEQNETKLKNKEEENNVVELKDIRSQLLSKLEDSDDEDNGGKVKLSYKEKKKLKKKDKKLTAKQLKNLQTHEHGIRKFDDL